MSDDRNSARVRANRDHCKHIEVVAFSLGDFLGSGQFHCINRELFDAWELLTEQSARNGAPKDTTASTEPAESQYLAGRNGVSVGCCNNDRVFSGLAPT